MSVDHLRVDVADVLIVDEEHRRILMVQNDNGSWTLPGGVRRGDEEASVYDVLVGENRVLRHYSFGNRWFEVNGSLDRSDRFVTEPGPIPWTFNCDISTPHFLSEADSFNLDLWIDVLVGPDGRTHAVLDEEDFALAVGQGRPTEIERAGAQQGLADLLQILRSEGQIRFLERICPFDTAGDAVPQPPHGDQARHGRSGAGPRQASPVIR